MNRHYDLELIAKATYKGNEYELEFDPYGDHTDMDEVKAALIEEIIESGDFEEPIHEDEVEVDIIDFGEIPEKWANENDCFDFAEAFAECEQDIDVVEAALECGVNTADIDEAYQGEFDDDEDFAQDMAEQTGAVDRDAKWPLYCIDWEQAAKDLMMDYTEHNGHYFRVF